MQAPPTLLYFDDEQGAALGLAQAAGLVPAPVQRHRFPDGEIRLRLPDALPERVVLLRTLDHPNEKLVDLLLAARTARLLGARHLTLVAPYLAYMRQDIAFVPGEAISQRIVGRFLAELFDAVVTVDPHLHRVATLQEAVPVGQAVVLSGAPAPCWWGRTVNPRNGFRRRPRATASTMRCAPNNAKATMRSRSSCPPCRWPGAPSC